MAGRPEAHTATLHDEPFPELLGSPCQVVISSDGQWIAGSSVTNRYSRVAVYRAADLSCVHLLAFRMEADSIAFHPTLPLLAVGLDNGDEYSREGGLTLLECGTGHRADFADPAWGIEPVRWLDDHTLELVFFALHDGVDPLMARATVVRGNWLGLTSDALDLTALERTPLDPEDPRVYDDIAPAAPLLRTLAERTGRGYDAQGGVRAVAGLGNGRVLATRKHVAVECWAADGSALWSVPAPSASGGDRIEVAADERSVRVAVSGPDARARTDFLLVDTADGTVLDRHSVPFSAAMSARADGVWALRDTYNRSFGTEPPTPPNTQIFAAGGSYRTGSVHVPDRYDLVPLQARRCPELLYGRSGRSVVALSPDGAVETVLFSVDAPLGRVVYASDAVGAALLHGRTELLRRGFPSGEVLWSMPLDSEVIDLDSHAGVLHVLCADDNLMSLDAADGTVLRRHPLPPYQPLCLHAAPDGTILVGTTSGQILRCPTMRPHGRTADR